MTVRQIRQPVITNPNAFLLATADLHSRWRTPPQPNGQLRVLTVRFFTEEGQRLPTENGAVRLAARTIVRATFTRPVSRAFFFLEPTGTETCELARLIGIDCPSATTGVAEVLWQVPRGTLGRVYVVACINSVCAKSGDVLVVRE